MGFGKMDELKKIMKEHEKYYAVDAKYCDWFGWVLAINKDFFYITRHFLGTFF